MVAERPVPEIGRDLLAGIEPRVQRQVAVDRAAPFLHRGEGVVIGMCHRRPLRNRG